ncbi:hypothetical protein [Priestia endophytica]|uniref:hypothetical protein n=1 Tax=Priestia endophytica TaxID=135735 RepID=UPI00124E3AE9|nr:hypothetical protein [Priestia endophytica]KAB2489979.1 hypothetical protein F8155_21550 [Priestia endophytica]
MNNHLEQLGYLEALESIRHMFRPSNYRAAMSDSLIYYFSFRYESPTEIHKQTNRVLKHYSVDPISFGYVRTVLGRR